MEFSIQNYVTYISVHYFKQYITLGEILINAINNPFIDLVCYK
jgi:hypothetical protein